MGDEVFRLRRRFIEQIADEEREIYLKIFRNNIKIGEGHEFRMFNGDMLLIIAGEERDEDQQSAATARWVPCVSGEIAEHRIPCMHSELPEPQRLAQVWAAISTSISAEEPGADHR